MVGAVLLKQQQLAEAERHATLAASLAQEHDRKSRAGAYELLAKIALKRKDREAALRYARLAEEADPSLPMPSYMQGLIEHAEGRYERAWPYFEEALRQTRERGIAMSELHFHAGDTLARLGRNAEAEAELKSEIALSPDHARARSSLAMLYRSEGRDAEAERTIVEMIRHTPTPEAYALAVRLWQMFGDPQRAASVRALAERQFGSRAQSGIPRDRR
jgi:tetratricopeptide (TPR) repeat protein